MKSLDPVRVYRTIIACRGNITRLLRELHITSTQMNIYLDDNPGLKQAFVKRAPIAGRSGRRGFA